MVAERAGYAATMFVIDVSPSMGKIRHVELPDGPDGQKRVQQITNLQWGLQFVLLKVQEMIFHNRKTDQCGVILFGTEETKNHIHDQHGGYDFVTEFIPIAHPTPDTLSKIASLVPSNEVGDPLDALIVAINVQEAYLAKKATWTRKITILTNGENPIETNSWEQTVAKLNENKVFTSIVGIDFDDDELRYKEEHKTEIKRKNELWYQNFANELDHGLLGTCAYVLQECSRPDIKATKSSLLATLLKFGDVEERQGDAVEILVRTSKATMITRPPSMKKFAPREVRVECMEVDEDAFSQLTRRTDYYVETPMEMVKNEGETEREIETKLQKVEKEQLIKGFKYGSTYVLCPEGQFDRMATKKGIEFCGFFPAANFRRDWSMGEVQYIWADPLSVRDQLALSSIIRAMIDKDVVAQLRLVSRDGMDPKMGVAMPRMLEDAECLLWVQMPYAEDFRKFPFRSLDNLVSKSGTFLSKHGNLVTDEMQDSMDKFVDSMDLMTAGDKNEDGERMPWFDTIYSYSPSVHRTKQALFHAAIVADLEANPLPPPHPDLTRFFEPPVKVLKKSKATLEDCKQVFKVKQVPAKVARRRNETHLAAEDDEDEPMLLDAAPIVSRKESTPVKKGSPSPVKPSLAVRSKSSSGEETEEEGDDAPTPLAQDVQLDPARAPGRIIGSTRPLVDFKANIAVGDVVSKAVEDLAWVIQDILDRPFSSRRTEELLTCMKELRQVSLQEDEIDQWNEFMRELKDRCKDDDWTGNKAFWTDVQKLGRSISLISKPEAEAAGGKSRVSESTAVKFLQD